MPIDWSNNARQLSAADFGAYDLMKALSSGQQFGQKQQMFPEELREAQLLNAIKKVQAQYAEPNAKQALIKAQQENEWNPQIWKSEIGLRNAQVPYYGAQTNKINAEMPYIGRTAQADLIAKQIANQKAQMDFSRERDFDEKFKNLTKNNNNQTINDNHQYPESHPSIYSGSKPDNSNEKIVSPGSQQLASIDEWYENNPISRSLLEKKGFKKVQQIKIDKSGKATLVTKYPSGKVTISSMDPNSKDENGIPLTNKMISQHQNVVASVDVAVPVLDKIINMENSDYSRFGGWTNKGAKYAGEVSQALDSLLGAFGLPQTNEGINTIREQLEIGHNEGAEEYRKRIKKLKEDILSRQKYSAGLVKKAIKIMGNENENDPYNLGSYDLSGE